MIDPLTAIMGAVMLIGGAVLAILGYGRAERRAGRQDTKDEANADTLDRIEKGRRAIDRDGTPDERVRRNDGAWD